MYFTAFLLLLSSELAAPGGAHEANWTYHDESSWPPLCAEGHHQSPVDIDSSRALPLPAAPLHFADYDAVPLSAANNGHTVQFTVRGADGARPRLAGGPLVQDYVLEQLHFHWLGEHAIDHVKYPMEIHLVHRAAGSSLREARLRAGGLAVLAVNCNVTTDERQGAPLAELVRSVPLLVNASSAIDDVGQLDLLRVLSNDPDSYFTYSGSLTTPPCHETVTWIILERPIPITDQQYRAFSAVQVGGIANFRRLQPLRSRAVFRPAPPSAAAAAAPPQSVAAAFAAALAASSGAVSAVSHLLNVSLQSAMKVKHQLLAVNITKKHR